MKRWKLVCIHCTTAGGPHIIVEVGWRLKRVEHTLSRVVAMVVGASVLSSASVLPLLLVGAVQSRVIICSILRRQLAEFECGGPGLH